MPDQTLHRCVAAMPRLEAVPALADFHDAVTRILDSDDPEAFWKCQEPLDALISGACLTAVINHELETFARDPLHIPDESTDQALTLVRTRDYALDLQVVPPQTPIGPFIRSSAQDVFMGLVSRGPVEVELYRQPTPFPHDVFDRRRALVHLGSARLRRGQSIPARAGHDCLALRPRSTEQVYLFFRSAPRLRVLWEYSSETLVPTKIISADASSSRLQYAARLLTAMGDREAIPSLMGLTTHPEHFVRWTAIQSLLALDLEKGLEALHAATLDPHPHVRNAARKGLAVAAAASPTSASA